MLKKSRSLVLSPLNKDFQKRVALLADEGHNLAQSYADLTVRMLNFAKQVKKLSDDAKRLDKFDRGQHYKYLRKELLEVVQSKNAAVLSKWNTIGEHASALLAYKSALPPQREALYEIALAIEEEKPIDRWVQKHSLTSESTVREVAALRKPKKRSRRHKDYLASVTLSFQTYEEAAEKLKELIVSDADLRVRSHQAFAEALKEKLDESRYATAAKKIS